MVARWEHTATSGPDDGPARDAVAVSRFIERFAALLTQSGVPRMPARVFSGLITADTGRLTSAQLGELLQVSPAGISGAVRYLAQVNLVSVEREPGTRRDVYRVHDDVWYEASLHREQELSRWEDALTEGVAALGRDSPAGLRMVETLAFFGFLQKEIPGVLARWRQERSDLIRDWYRDNSSTPPSFATHAE